MESTNDIIDVDGLTSPLAESTPKKVKEESNTLVRKCRAKSQGIYLDTSYREMQIIAKELGLPCNLKVSF